MQGRPASRLSYRIRIPTRPLLFSVGALHYDICIWVILYNSNSYKDRSVFNQNIKFLELWIFQDEEFKLVPTETKFPHKRPFSPVSGPNWVKLFVSRSSKNVRKGPWTFFFVFRCVLVVEIHAFHPLFRFFIKLGFGTIFSYLLHIDFSLKTWLMTPPQPPIF